MPQEADENVQTKSQASEFGVTERVSVATVDEAHIKNARAVMERKRRARTSAGVASTLTSKDLLESGSGSVQQLQPSSTPQQGSSNQLAVRLGNEVKAMLDRVKDTIETLIDKLPVKDQDKKEEWKNRLQPMAEALSLGVRRLTARSTLAWFGLFALTILMPLIIASAVFVFMLIGAGKGKQLWRRAKRWAQDKKNHVKEAYADKAKDWAYDWANKILRYLGLPELGAFIKRGWCAPPPKTTPPSSCRH